MGPRHRVDRRKAQADAAAARSALAAGVYDPEVAFAGLAAVAVAGSALTWRVARGETFIRLHSGRA